MSSHITPPPVKFELHAYGQTHDVNNFLLDWNKIEVILARKDTSGVYMEVTFPFKFVLDAYEIVEAIFETHGFRAKADMYIYIRNNDWTYDDPTVFNLDFSTYEQSDAVIEINSRRSDLYEQLREKESVDFDIPVNDVKEDLRWNNTRIKVSNSLTETIYSDPEGPTYMDGNNPVAVFNKTLGISYETSEILVKGVIEEKTTGDNLDVSDDDCFLIAKQDVTLELELKLTGRLSCRYSAPANSPRKTDFIIGVSKSIGGGLVIGDGYLNISIDSLKDHAASIDVDINQTSAVKLKAGEKLYLTASGIPDRTDDVQYQIQNESHLEGKLIIKYKGKNNPDNIDIINPNRLLQKLVDKITETEEYTGNPPCPAMIENFNEDDQDLTMLVAAESIRGFERTEDYTGAKVHTSYKDFKEWMATQGYEPFVNENQLRFRKREESFNKNLAAIELYEEDCSDLKISVDTDYLFSGLKIGYQKKEYENTNGRFEFNGQHDYTTDYTGNAKAMELISPYRADCYGIEFLAQERGKDTTDDKSDKDLFLVNVKKGSEAYETVYRTMTDETNIIPPDILETLFNAKYNPFELLKLNAGLLGASVNTLKFTASDANKDISVNEEMMDGDYTIPEETKLFDAITYDFASRNIKELPSGDNRNGVVRIHYKEKIYEGFIREISKNPAWEAETQWALFKKHSV